MGTLRNLAAFGLAVVSFGVAVGLVVGFEKLTGLDLFAMMWVFVLPFGAFVTGLLAASGYYLGAVRLGVRSTWPVAAGMLLLAVLVQLALYGARYEMTQTPYGIPVSQLMGFPQFVGWMLSHEAYRTVDAVTGSGGSGAYAIGAFGYVVAVLQLLGVAAGGLAMFAGLALRPYCEACHRYPRRVLARRVPYDGDLWVVDDLRGVPPGSAAYLAKLRAMNPGGHNALALSLWRCGGCGREAVAEQPMVRKRGGLTNVPRTRRTAWLEPGIALEEALAAVPGPGRWA